MGISPKKIHKTGLGGVAQWVECRLVYRMGCQTGKDRCRWEVEKEAPARQKAENWRGGCPSLARGQCG